jgi:hypothetical protein
LESAYGLCATSCASIREDLESGLATNEKAPWPLAFSSR